MDIKLKYNRELVEKHKSLSPLWYSHSELKKMYM